MAKKKKKASKPKKKVSKTKASKPKKKVSKAKASKPKKKVSKAKASKPKKKASKAKKSLKPKAKGLMAKIAEEQRRIEKSEKKTVKSGKKLFGEATKHLFKEFPELKKFSWAQYTPHWNDGDECLFRCNLDYVALNDDKDTKGLWDLENLRTLLSGDLTAKKSEITKKIAAGGERWEIERLESELEELDLDPSEVEKEYRMRKAISDILGNISEDAYQSMFGEGLITVTRHGVEVSEYEHE